jgi:hypothetical protein
MKKQKKKCVICGFDKVTHEHHLKMLSEYGLDKQDNIVTLCLNHHWIADFGDKIDQEILLRKIYEITKKKPLLDVNKMNYYEKLIRAYIESEEGSYTDEEYFRLHKGVSRNYFQVKTWLLNEKWQRGGDPELRAKIVRQAEAHLIINKLLKMGGI